MSSSSFDSRSNSTTDIWFCFVITQFLFYFLFKFSSKKQYHLQNCIKQQLCKNQARLNHLCETNNFLEVTLLRPQIFSALWSDRSLGTVGFMHYAKFQLSTTVQSCSCLKFILYATEPGWYAEGQSLSFLMYSSLALSWFWDFSSLFFRFQCSLYFLSSLNMTSVCQRLRPRKSGLETTQMRLI